MKPSHKQTHEDSNEDSEDDEDFDPPAKKTWIKWEELEMDAIHAAVSEVAPGGAPFSTNDYKQMMCSSTSIRPTGSRKNTIICLPFESKSIVWWIRVRSRRLQAPKRMHRSGAGANGTGR